MWWRRNQSRYTCHTWCVICLDDVDVNIVRILVGCKRVLVKDKILGLKYLVSCSFDILPFTFGLTRNLFQLLLVSDKHSSCYFFVVIIFYRLDHALASVWSFIFFYLYSYNLIERLVIFFWTLGSIYTFAFLI